MRGKPADSVNLPLIALYLFMFNEVNIFVGGTCQRARRQDTAPLHLRIVSWLNEWGLHFRGWLRAVVNGADDSLGDHNFMIYWITHFRALSIGARDLWAPLIGKCRGGESPYIAKRHCPHHHHHFQMLFLRPINFPFSSLFPGLIGMRTPNFHTFPEEHSTKERPVLAAHHVAWIRQGGVSLFDSSTINRIPMHAFQHTLLLCRTSAAYPWNLM